MAEAEVVALAVDLEVVVAVVATPAVPVLVMELQVVVVDSEVVEVATPKYPRVDTHPARVPVSTLNFLNN